MILKGQTRNNLEVQLHQYDDPTMNLDSGSYLTFTRVGNQVKWNQWLNPVPPQLI